MFSEALPVLGIALVLAAIFGGLVLIDAFFRKLNAMTRRDGGDSGGGSFDSDGGDGGGD